VIRKIIIKPLAKEMLKAISDLRIQEQIAAAIEKLASHSDTLGKNLGDELMGYRSIRTAGQRYRIIYRIQDQTVFIVSLGIRKQGSKKDVYLLTQKLLRRGLL